MLNRQFESVYWIRICPAAGSLDLENEPSASTGEVITLPGERPSAPKKFTPWS
jgi:hypothetical protein